MGINIKEYGEFLNESFMDPETATENIIKLVKKSAGWIDPYPATDLFLDMTGLKEEDHEVDKMLGTLMDLDLLYYEDEKIQGKRGKKVELEDPSELPNRSTDDGKYPGMMESLNFKIKKLDEFH